MNYIVSEVQPDPAVGMGEVKVFTTLSDAVKHIQKINNSERWLFGEREGNLNMLRGVLMERLSTVSLVGGLESEKRWVITAI